jgi:two-component system, chemotaxis family, chemotaxis protein CheY
VITWVRAGLQVCLGQHLRGTSIKGCVAVPTTILIVDDNDFVRAAMRKILEARADFKVCGEATNGRQAVEKFRALRPDCVVLDFSMPVMNGIDAAREIMKIAPGIPLLLCTMYGSEQVTKAAKEVGVKRVVSKSEKLSANLIATIDALVARRRTS